MHYVFSEAGLQGQNFACGSKSGFPPGGFPYLLLTLRDEHGVNGLFKGRAKHLSIAISDPLPSKQLHDHIRVRLYTDTHSQTFQLADCDIEVM